MHLLPKPATREEKMTDALPGYTQASIKAELLAAGVSGTVYALVMPESEAALAQVVDGCDRNAFIDDPAALDAARRVHWLDRYREPWTQKQDGLHEAYFDRWLKWSAAVVDVDGAAFPYRYPTAGASEGIYKLMAEHAARVRTDGGAPEIHLFDGEYEGFPAFAAALSLPLVRHRRDDWRSLLHRSRHGRRDRRDGGDRRRLHALPRRDPGRRFLGQGQAPPDAGARRGGRRGRQDPGWGGGGGGDLPGDPAAVRLPGAGAGPGQGQGRPGRGPTPGPGQPRLHRHRGQLLAHQIDLVRFGGIATTKRMCLGPEGDVEKRFVRAPGPGLT